MARRFTFGDVRLTRVPYFDVSVDAATVGLTSAEVLAIPWAVPTWANHEGQVRVGQAAWVVETDQRVLVLDPCGAADAFLRTGPEALVHQRAFVDALTSAGFSVDDVDAVILSHLDGIGMTAARDERRGWLPLFPRARVVLSDAELERVRAAPQIDGAAALLALVEQGHVDAVGPRWPAGTDVTVEVTGGHTAGHVIVRIADGAVFLGHLAVSPLNAAVEPRPGSHDDAPVAQAALEHELDAAATDHRLVIGPLWPEPGAGRVSGPPWSITPV